MLGIARPFTAAKLDFSQVLMDKFDPKVEVSKDVCLCLSQKLRSKLIPLASEFTNWSQLEYFAINGLNLGAERFERLVDLVRRKSLMLDQSHHCFPELSLQLTPLLFQTFQSCGIFHNQSNVVLCGRPERDVAKPQRWRPVRTSYGLGSMFPPKHRAPRMKRHCQYRNRVIRA